MCNNSKMIRTPYHATVQQNLFLSLQQAAESPKKQSQQFFEQCSNVDRDLILSARDLRVEFHNLTLLHMSSRLGLTKVVEHLLSLGQEIDVIDTSVSKRTPLMEAIAFKQEDTAYLLVKYGAKLDHQDVNGENAFHYAAKAGARMLRALYTATDLSKANIKALVSVSNIKHQFPEDKAANAITKEALMELRQYGCRISKTKKKRSRKVKGKTMVTTGVSSAQDNSDLE